MAGAKLIPAGVLTKLARLGLSEEQAEAVASMLSDVEAATKAECESAPARTARQERNARYYRKASEKRLKASETSYSDARRLNSDASDPLPPEVSSPAPPSSSPQSPNPPSPPKGGSSPVRKPEVDEALAAYSAMAKATGLADVRVFSDARRRSLAAILAKHGLPTWLEAVERVGASDFCHGIGGRDGWKADLDFMLQPKSFGRILEGHYANRAMGHRATAPPTMLADVTAERIRQRSYANGHSDHHDGPEIDGSLERGTGKQSPPALFFTSD